MTDAQRTILKQIVSIVATDSLRPVKLIMMVLGIIGVVGFTIRPDMHEIHFLTTMMPVWIWASLFALVSISRFIKMFTRINNKIFLYAVASVGVWLWTMVFTSCMLAGEWGLNFLYLVPIMIEAWILGRGIYDHDMSDQLNQRRRKTDKEANE